MRLHVRRDLGLITLAGLVVRLCFITDPGHVVDLTTFGQWALAAADNPWNRAYEVTNANYPPAALLIFELIGRVYRAFVHADPAGTTLRVALKLPTVIFDLAGGGVAYAIAARFTGHRNALVGVALLDLNPAIVYDSSLWGQNDSITTVSALTAVWCMLRGQRFAAWIVLSFAILNKPPVLVLAPLFALEALTTGDPRVRRSRLVQTAAGIAGALIFSYAVAVPFYTDRAPIAVFGRMIAWYQTGSSLYPFNSANGFNVYALFGEFFAPDTTPVLLVPLKYWADAAFIALAAAIYRRYVTRGDGRALLEASFLVLLAFFLILTEMHERYLMYALTFVAPLAAIDLRYRWFAGALTITEWLNLEYSLTYMWVQSDKPAGINPKAFAPVLARLCALTNIAVFIASMRLFLGAPIEPAPSPGTAPRRP